MEREINYLTRNAFLWNKLARKLEARERREAEEKEARKKSST